MTNFISSEKSKKYKHVFKWTNSDKLVFYAVRLGYNHTVFKTEREAAIFADKQLILKGKEPINILKRKTR